MTALYSFLYLSSRFKHHFNSSSSSLWQIFILKKFFLNAISNNILTNQQPKKDMNTFTFITYKNMCKNTGSFPYQKMCATRFSNLRLKKKEWKSFNLTASFLIKTQTHTHTQRTFLLCDRDKSLDAYHHVAGAFFPIHNIISRFFFRHTPISWPPPLLIEKKIRSNVYTSKVVTFFKT